MNGLKMQNARLNVILPSFNGVQGQAIPRVCNPLVSRVNKCVLRFVQRRSACTDS